MLRRALIISIITLLLPVAAMAGLFHHKKLQNPLANVDSKQPDKILFDRAEDAMRHSKYDVARITLQTLINTYPDSEYIARAKLAVGDSWYAEGGSTGLAQAEIEYKDFITFFPNMPEAAEAQLKVANIHYRQMEKPDRDYTHAKRAEDEYRQLILQFPDSKLVPQAEQRLREVQEVLGEGEFRIGKFYYMRESWPAAIARLQTLVDTYPLYSLDDEALYMLGDAYEREIATARAARTTNEVAKGRLIADFTNHAATAYDRIITRYPATDRFDDAKHCLQALGRPIPTPTPQAIAQSKAEEASRRAPGMVAKMMGTFHSRPDVSMATKVGGPTMDPPQESSAVELIRQAGRDISGPPASDGNSVSIETVKSGTPPPNEAATNSSHEPASDSSQQNSASESAGAAPSATDSTAPVAATTSPAPTNNAPQGSSPANSDTTIPVLKPLDSNAPQQPSSAQPSSAPQQQPQSDQQPVPGPQASNASPASVLANASAPTQNVTSSAKAPVAPPAQVNDAAQSSSADSATPQNLDSSKNTTSSNKKKKKKGLRKVMPF